MSKKNKESIWSESDSDEGNQTKAAIIQSFHTVKEFFEPEYQQSEDNSNSKNQEPLPRKDIERTEIVIPDNKEVNDKGSFLQKKHERDAVNETMFVEESQPEGDIGPQPFKIEYNKKDERKLYQGMNINPMEAQIYSQYIQQGKRIPRRGEVGISSNEIEYFESIGYVMSGTRHKKMNAARQRIENKVYTAEDKRALSIFILEENLRKEKNVINGFMNMMKNNPNPNPNN